MKYGSKTVASNFTDILELNKAAYNKYLQGCGMDAIRHKQYDTGKWCRGDHVHTEGHQRTRTVTQTCCYHSCSHLYTCRHWNTCISCGLSGLSAATCTGGGGGEDQGGRGPSQLTAKGAWSCVFQGPRAAAKGQMSVSEGCRWKMSLAYNVYFLNHGAGEKSKGP